MIKVELLISESGTSSVESLSLMMEAYRPGYISKKDLRYSLERVLGPWITYTIGRVERLNCANLPAAMMLVDECPSARGQGPNQNNQSCIGCELCTPMRHEICRHIWPHMHEDIDVESPTPRT